jgi:UDP-N-acetylglucosamine diphosphorylase/glucosamine-1-phosphate N-acetyltransferase
MKTVILAAGAGNRVKPLSINKSKLMFKIMGKPLLQYVIENVAAAGIKDMIVVIGRNGDEIKSYFSNGSKFGVNIQYVKQEKAIGMADAVVSAKDLVGDNFLVVNGGDVFEPSLIKSMIDEFENGKTDIVLSCKPVKKTWKFGIIAKDGNGFVRKFVEKPKKGEEPSNLAVIGVYILTKKIFDYYEKVSVSDQQYEDAIQSFIDDGGKVRAINYDGFFGSFKYPWDLLNINKYFMDKLLTERIISGSASISDKAVIDGNVFIGDNVKVLEGAVIKGPCYIGAGTLIGTNACVRDYSNIEENCLIGVSSEVARSIIGDGCWLHTNYIGDSILSDNCKFGAGTKTANLRFDEKSVRVNIKGKPLDTGMKKFGIIAAENCRTGINASLMPGIKMGPNSIVGAGVCLQEDLEPNKIVLLDKESYVIKENKI